MGPQKSLIGGHREESWSFAGEDSVGSQQVRRSEGCTVDQGRGEEGTEGRGSGVEEEERKRKRELYGCEGKRGLRRWWGRLVTAHRQELHTDTHIHPYIHQHFFFSFEGSILSSMQPENLPWL